MGSPFKEKNLTMLWKIADVLITAPMLTASPFFSYI